MKSPLILLIAFFFACSDASKDEMIINGVILSADSKKAMPNIPVSVELTNEGITYFGQDWIDGKIYFVNPVLINTVSNSAGKFLFKIDSKKYKYYRVKTSEQFMEVNKQPDIIADLISSKVVFDTLLVGAASNLKIIVKNSALKDGDVVAITLPYNNPYTTDRVKFYDVNPIYFSAPLGKPKPEIISFTYQFLSDFNKSAFLTISVTRDQQTLSSTKEIPLVNQQTTEYLLEY